MYCIFPYLCQNTGAALLDENEVLQSHTALAGNVDARFDGHNHPFGEEPFGKTVDRRRLVNGRSDREAPFCSHSDTPRKYMTC